VFDTLIGTLVGYFDRPAVGDLAAAPVADALFDQLRGKFCCKLQHETSVS